MKGSLVGGVVGKQAKDGDCSCLLVLMICVVFVVVERREKQLITSR